MRVPFIISILLFTATTTLAQNVENSTKGAEIETYELDKDTVMASPEAYTAMPTHTYDTSGFAPSLLQQAATDSLHLPLLNMKGQVMPIGMYPLAWCGWNNWDLHKGLNVTVGASVFAQFGKHAHHGAGFSQNISMMYAMPITDKLSFAVGGYFNNTYWAHDNFRDTGLTAVLGYKFNEHWEAYVYGQKSITNNYQMSPYLYNIGNMGDRIGAAVKYNFNESSSIQLSVETSNR